jgi:hypothetical protein
MEAAPWKRATGQSRRTVSGSPEPRSVPILDLYSKHLRKAGGAIGASGMNIQELADLTDQELVTGAMREMQTIAKTSCSTVSRTQSAQL